MQSLILISVVSYLIGAIPFGFIVSSLLGINILDHGSSSIGATNVTRVLGRRWGVLVFCLDGVKGLVATMLFIKFGHAFGIIAALFAVFGHIFPMYLNFKGGKGVATSIIPLLVIEPISLAIFCMTWFVVFKQTKFVSLASLMGITTTALFSCAKCMILPSSFNWLSPVYLTIVSVLIIFSHRTNIGRLFSGTELSFKK